MQDWNTSWTATNNFETWCAISSQSIYRERLHEQWSWDTNNSQIHSEVGIGNHSKISKIPLQENPASTKQEYLEDEDDYCSSNNIKKKQDYCESTVLLAHFLWRKLCLPEKEKYRAVQVRLQKIFGELIDHFIVTRDESCIMMRGNGAVSVIASKSLKKSGEKTQDSQASITIYWTGQRTGETGLADFSVDWSKR